MVNSVFTDPLNPARDADEFGRRQYPAIPMPTEKPEDLVATVLALKQAVEMLTKQVGLPETFCLNASDLVELNVLEPWVLTWLGKRRY